MSWLIQRPRAGLRKGTGFGRLLLEVGLSVIGRFWWHWTMSSLRLVVHGNTALIDIRLSLTTSLIRNHLSVVTVVNQYQSTTSLLSALFIVFCSFFFQWFSCSLYFASLALHSHCVLWHLKTTNFLHPYLPYQWEHESQFAYFVRLEQCYPLKLPQRVSF